MRVGRGGTEAQPVLERLWTAEEFSYRDREPREHINGTLSSEKLSRSLALLTWIGLDWIGLIGLVD